MRFASISLVVLFALACREQSIGLVLDGPWPSELDTVALTLVDSVPVGAPRYIAPGSAVKVELGEEAPVEVELRRLQPRRPGQHDLAACGISLGDANPLVRDLADVWRVGPLGSGDPAPSLALDPMPPIRPLSTDGFCDAQGCNKIDVRAAEPSIGSGEVLRIASRTSEVLLLFAPLDDPTILYRWDGRTIVPAPQLDVEPAPSRRLVDLASVSEEVLLLYESGAVWSVDEGGIGRRLTTAIGATHLAVSADAAYAYGDDKLWDLATSTSSAPIDATPRGFRLASVGPRGDLYGTADDSIWVRRAGQWAREYQRNGLGRRRGGFAFSAEDTIYFGDESIIERDPASGEWIEEPAIVDLGLNGGVIEGDHFLSYGESGVLIYRSHRDAPWCELQSGTFQQLSEGVHWQGAMLVGVSSDANGSGLLRITLP